MKEQKRLAMVNQGLEQPAISSKTLSIMTDHEIKLGALFRIYVRK
ncbi:hypothetical protein [Paenibacillus sp. SI8]